MRVRRMLVLVTAVNQETAGTSFGIGINSSQHLWSNALNLFARPDTDEGGIRPHNHDVTCRTIRPLYTLPDHISGLR